LTFICIRHILASRKAFEEDSDARRERIAIEALLKDAVRKSVRMETEREGMMLYLLALCAWIEIYYRSYCPKCYVWRGGDGRHSREYLARCYHTDASTRS
jgi:hypothetical protein